MSADIVDKLGNPVGQCRFPNEVMVSRFTAGWLAVVPHEWLQEAAAEIVRLRGEVPYDRELIAQMLDELSPVVGLSYIRESVDEQARLLRAAANAAVSPLYTTPKPAGGEAVARWAEIARDGTPSDWQQEMGALRKHFAGITTPPAAQVQQEAGEPMTGDLLPCPFCGKARQDRWPCEWLDGSGTNVIRCAWCHGAAPMNVWNRRAAHPSACELGAVRELVKVWRIAVNSASTTNKQDLRPERFIRELEAALQHRGDSRGGEG